MNAMRGLAFTFILSAGWATALADATQENPANFQVVTNGTTVTVTRTNTVDGATLLQSFPDGDLVRRLELVIGAGAAPACFYPTEASALPDGIHFCNGQWRVKRASALGTGPILLGRESSSAQLVCLDCGVADVTNKIVLGHLDSALLATSTANYWHLHSLGVTNNITGPLLGRASGTSRITLALTEDSNDYLKQIRLQGALSPFALDGGTLRIAKDAKAPFFSHVGNAADKTASTYGLGSSAPVTLDAKKGANTRLGLPLPLPGREGKNLSEQAIANDSFETKSGANATGWTFSRLDSATGAQVGVKSNGESTWVPSSCTTPFGSNFYVLRCLHRIVTANPVALNAATNWYVSFYAASRHDWNSHKVKITVRLTENTTRAAYEYTTEEQPAYYTFKEFLLGPYNLPTGNYLVTIETSWPGSEYDSNYWSAVSVDNVKLFQPTWDPDTFVKTGEGRVVVDGVTAGGAAFDVRQGTLALQQSTVTHATATVADGSTFELGPELALSGEGLTVNVASNGTFALNELKDLLVANRYFEESSVADYSAGWVPEWVLTRVKATDANSNKSGLQRNGGTMSPPPNGPYSEYGDTTAFLRNDYRLSQTVKVPEAGTYRFSFAYARRDMKYIWNTFHFKAYVAKDGVTNTFDNIAFEPRYQRFAQTLQLEAGTYSIGAETYGENEQVGPMVFIDDVSLSRVAPLGDVTNVTVNLTRGAKVRLENIEPVHIQDVFVDGVRVNGSERALRRAGVEVSGTGKLRVGDRLGMMILLR